MRSAAARLAGLAAAAIATLLPTASVAQPSVDPRALFTEGQYRAAAAAYEERWRASKGSADGLNAVIAWRTAGRYAHARALLSMVRDDKLQGDLVSRAELLDRKLGELTGSIELTGDVLPREAVVLVDRGPVERAQGAMIVDVGRRELTIDRAGCERFRWSGVVRPDQRVSVPVALVCHALPGSLHVTLHGGGGARLRIDDRVVAMQEYDYATPLDPGLHDVHLERRGVKLYDERLRVDAAASQDIDVRVPWRAKSSGLIVAAASFGIAATNGATAAAGLGLGYIRSDITGGAPADPGISAELLVLGGVATTGVGEDEGEGSGARPWLGMIAGVLHILPPLWQRRSGRIMWILDFDPGIGTFQAAPTSRDTAIRGISETARVLYIGVSALTLTAELPILHAELALWPVGLASHTGFGLTGDDRPSKLTHAASIGLTIGESFLGN